MEPVNESPRLLGNRYEVGDLLGRGGMAEVHLGRDTRLGRVVAIKLLRTDLARDPTFQARFRREAQSAAALNHPAIVAVYDTGEEHSVEAGGGVVPLPYIVMEYVEGRTLRELLQDGHPLDVGLALEVTAGVVSALDYSHRAGIVHRDIKPANVMLTPNGDVKVMDFGIARALADASATMTQTQAVIGTAQYLSPEQARGETVDARSDLYSAGCLLYELITGRPPFVADSPVAVAYQHVREQPQPPSTFNPQIPEAVDRIVLHSLAKDRETRYQTAAAFRADIDAARTGRPVGATVPAGGGVDPEAATQYLTAAGAGTRAMQPVPGATMGGPVLPGLPPVNDDDLGYTARRDVRDDPPKSRGWIYALVALAVLLVFGGGAYFVSQTLSGAGEPLLKAVPTVVDRNVDLARATLEGQGFKVTETPVTNRAAKGTVVAQDPKGGVRVAEGSTVVLTVSTGPSSVQVPDVKGLSQERARQLIEAAGLRVGNVAAENVNEDKDEVTRTEPEIGTPVAVNSVVNLFVASGEVAVPKVEGDDLETARKKLEDLGLRVRPASRVREGVTPGTVIETQPDEGVTVPIDSEVRVIVAVAPPPPTTEPPPTTPTDTASPSPSASESTPDDGGDDGGGGG